MKKILMLAILGPMMLSGCVTTHLLAQSHYEDEYYDFTNDQYYYEGYGLLGLSGGNTYLYVSANSHRVLDFSFYASYNHPYRVYSAAACIYNGYPAYFVDYGNYGMGYITARGYYNASRGPVFVDYYYPRGRHCYNDFWYHYNDFFYHNRYYVDHCYAYSRNHFHNYRTRYTHYNHDYGYSHGYWYNGVNKRHTYYNRPLPNNSYNGGRQTAGNRPLPNNSYNGGRQTAGNRPLNYGSSGGRNNNQSQGGSQSSGNYGRNNQRQSGSYSNNGGGSQRQSGSYSNSSGGGNRSSGNYGRSSGGSSSSSRGGSSRR